MSDNLINLGHQVEHLAVVTHHKDKDGSTRTEVEIMPSVKGAVTGAIAGAAVGGPPGALIGGFLGLILGPKD